MADAIVQQLARIVCGIDFSDASWKALEHAGALAAWYDGRVLALHIYETAVPVAAPGVAAPIHPPDPAEMTEALRRFCTSAPQVPHDRIDVEVGEGDAARQLARRAAAAGAGLLVLGSHGRGGFERLFLGSVTEKVLRSTDVPVLVVPPGARDGATPLFKTILCGVDFSDVSLRAVEYALLLAREADAQLVLAHVVEGVIDQAALASTPHLPVADYVRDRALEATVRLQALIPDEARIWSRPETRVASGRASRELVNLAGELGAELMVLGAHGRGTVDRWLFGSTTDYVIRRVTCPVLSVRSPTDAS